RDRFRRVRETVAVSSPSRRGIPNFFCTRNICRSISWIWAINDSFRSESRTISFRVALGIFRSIASLLSRAELTLQVMRTGCVPGMLECGSRLSAATGRYFRDTEVPPTLLRLHLMRLVHGGENAAAHDEQSAGQGERDDPYRRDGGQSKHLDENET